MIKAVLFDYDGVLVDSLELNHKGTCAVLRSAGVKEITFEEFCRDYEAPYMGFFRARGITASREEVKCWYLEEVLKYPNPPLMENALDVLFGLAEKGLTLGIVSAHNYRHLVAQLEKDSLFSFFRSVIGDQEVKTDAISSFCRLFGFAPHEVLFVGDLPSDIRDGNNAGVTTIFFQGKFNVRIKYQPSYSIKDLREILDIVEEKRRVP